MTARAFVRCAELRPDEDLPGLAAKGARSRAESKDATLERKAK